MGGFGREAVRVSRVRDWLGRAGVSGPTLRAARSSGLEATAPAAGCGCGGEWRIDDRESGKTAQGVYQNKAFHISLAGFYTGGATEIEGGQPGCDHGSGGKERTGDAGVMRRSLILESKIHFGEL